MKLYFKSILLFIISSVLMFLSMFFIAKYDYKTAIFIAFGAGILTYIIPLFNKRK